MQCCLWKLDKKIHRVAINHGSRDVMLDENDERQLKTGGLMMDVGLPTCTHREVTAPETSLLHILSHAHTVYGAQEKDSPNMWYPDHLFVNRSATLCWPRTGCCIPKPLHFRAVSRKASSIYNMNTEFVDSNPNSGTQVGYEPVLQSHVFEDVMQCRPLTINKLPWSVRSSDVPLQESQIYRILIFLVLLFRFAIVLVADRFPIQGGLQMSHNS
jgi:hypothetical protein